MIDITYLDGAKQERVMCGLSERAPDALDEDRQNSPRQEQYLLELLFLFH